METTSAFEFPESFENNLILTAQRMLAEGLNILEISGSEGLVLIRVGTPEEKRRKGSQMPIAPFEEGGETFIVCAK